MLKKKWLLAVGVLVFVSTMKIGCSGGKMEDQKAPEEKKNHYKSFDAIPDSALGKLAKKKIYFGHQSVGFNIIGGIKDLMKENPKMKLNISETTEYTDFKNGIFAHSRIGKNTYPIVKINDFERLMDEGIGNIADVAFMKFCFVDINSKTDIKKVFSEYKKCMSKLVKKYPKTTFVYLSVPLCITKETWKTKLKKVFGVDDIWEYKDNIKRNEFNRLLEKEYAKSRKLFDIATIESTYPDGKRSVFQNNDKTYYSLVPDYTYDGGHLNEIGRKITAEKLLLFLVNLN